MADELRGWKEIGAYFDVSPRTAQRWEREYAMPIHRMGRTRGASVFALRAELDHWHLSPDGVRASSDNAESPVAPPPANRAERSRRFSRVAVLTAAAFLVLVGVVLVLLVRSRKPGATTVFGPKAVVEGYAATNSSSILRLKVTTQDTGAILFHVFDGGMATVAIRDGAKLGLVADTASGKGRLSVYEVTAAEPSGNETVKELKVLPLARSVPVHLDHHGVQMDVEWLGTVVTSSVLPARAPDAPPPHCCVVCERFTICAAQVSGICGNCCGYEGCRHP